ncbi:MAG: DUF4340 domain-containing protein, partial [Oscillospiraceae bacterium]|nr:DUF4340 domain-containing protein [Oscillospiraceae bacterium]
ALLLTKPKPKLAANLASIGTEDPSAYIIDRRADEVFSITVDNSLGNFTFTRKSRLINYATESGEQKQTEEYFWTSEELCGVPQSDNTVRNFIGDLASLPEKSAVENDADDLSKYGLDEPTATALLRFDDGTTFEMRFGIISPIDEGSVYFALGGTRDVKLVNAYAVSEVFSDVRQFARLLMTDSTTPPETLTITRPDLDAPLELEMTPAIAEDAAETFRFTAPISVEISSAKGRKVFYGACGLTMQSCEFPEQSDEILEQCGLLTPQAVVKFTIGETDYELKIGTETETGYYATVSGIPGVYVLAAENAPWLTATVGGLVSRKPLSPYIFSVGRVDVKLPSGEFTFTNENETFACNGSAIDYERFREYFNSLTAELDGEELTGGIGETLLTEITFSYKTDEYGRAQDTLAFYALDERRAAVVLNDTPLFSTKRINVEKIAELTTELVAES